MWIGGFRGKFGENIVVVLIGNSMAEATTFANKIASTYGITLEEITVRTLGGNLQE